MQTTQSSPNLREALTRIGVEPHAYDMRLKFQECFVCGAPVNFMRLYDQHKKYCPLHDDATGELAHAIATLNHPGAA